MVCIAAFIILCLLSIFVGILSIFKKDLGKKYWKTFKKSWGCVWKRVRLQKCETSFKSDIKNSILSKFIVKKPKLVKPLSVGIEIAAVLVVVVTVWSLATALKSGLSLWVFGTCEVSIPSSCSLGAEACSIDRAEAGNIIEATGRWFTDWGEIFAAIPGRLRNWQVKDFYSPPRTAYYNNDPKNSGPIALDILDPGCVVCLQSYKNKQRAGFFQEYNVAIMLYPIRTPDGEYMFKNSGIIARYLEAIILLETKKSLTPLSMPRNATWEIINRLFTEMTEHEGQRIINQTLFNEYYSNARAEKVLQEWLADLNYSEEEITLIAKTSNSKEVARIMENHRNIVENKVRARGIPTTIYDGRLRTGLFEQR